MNWEIEVTLANEGGIEISYLLPYGDQGQNKRRENTKTPLGNSKDLGAPQGMLCTKSLGRSTVQWTMEKTKDVSTGMQKRGMCASECRSSARERTRRHSN